MCVNSIMVFLKGCCFLLSGTWGFVLLPFAMALIYQKKVKAVGTVLLTAVALFFALLFHDVVAYQHNKRPIIPFYEWFFSLLSPRDGLNSVLVDVPLSNCTTNISHYWRGAYGVDVWVPDKMWDISERDRELLSRAVHLCGSFSLKDELLVSFNSLTNYPKKGMWSSEHGGSIIHYEYNVPNDLPLDEVLTFETNVAGDMQGFVSRFPEARLRIEMLCIK